MGMGGRRRMIVSPAAPPPARLDVPIRQCAFKIIRNGLAEFEDAGRADPAVSKSFLQADLVGLTERLPIPPGGVFPFGTDLVPLIEACVADGCMIFAQLRIESGNTGFATAIETEVRARANLTSDRLVGADDEATLTCPEDL